VPFVPGTDYPSASFAVEEFSLDRLQTITRFDLDQRMERYRKMLSF